MIGNVFCCEIVSISSCTYSVTIEKASKHSTSKAQQRPGLMRFKRYKVCPSYFPTPTYGLLVLLISHDLIT
jgi:hypothetical protein